MSTIKQRYSNEVLDEIICYFMKTILRLQNSGIEKLPIENHFMQPVKSYLKLAVELIIDGQPVEISELILDTEYDAILVGGGVDTKTLLVLRMIGELSKHIHYDDDYSSKEVAVYNVRYYDWLLKMKTIPLEDKNIGDLDASNITYYISDNPWDLKNYDLLHKENNLYLYKHK